MLSNIVVLHFSMYRKVAGEKPCAEPTCWCSKHGFTWSSSRASHHQTYGFFCKEHVYVFTIYIQPISGTPDGWTVCDGTKYLLWEKPQHKVIVLITWDKTRIRCPIWYCFIKRQGLLSLHATSRGWGYVSIAHPLEQCSNVFIYCSTFDTQWYSLWSHRNIFNRLQGPW